MAAALEDVRLQLPDPAGRPEPVEAFLARAERFHEAFVEAIQEDPIPAYVASNGAAVFDALHALRTHYLTRGNVFCEWGSGLGVATSLAAWLGFEAYGIEVRRRLVEASEELARGFADGASFACGSFLPEGADHHADRVQEMAWLDAGAPPAYDALSLEPDDIDVVFAYPWPGEEDAVFECFREVAGRGALILTWHGVEGMRAQRKVRR